MERDWAEEAKRLRTFFDIWEVGNSGDGSEDYGPTALYYSCKACGAMVTEQAQTLHADWHGSWS